MVGIISFIANTSIAPASKGGVLQATKASRNE
jgi:predicted outer membrane repeat protein